MNPVNVIIYHGLSGWKCTSESNYNAFIQDARKVYDLGDDLQNAIEIVKRNFGNDFKVIAAGA